MMTTMIKTRTLAATALCAAITAILPAQTAAQVSGNRFIPENSSFVVRIASPAKWSKQFGTTQAAKLFQGNALAPFIGMAKQRIEMGMGMLRDSGMFNADLAEGLLNDWQGDIILSAQVDWDGFLDAMDFGEAPPVSFVVALSPDGKFDLAAVAKEFEQMVEKTAPDGGGLTDLTVGDLTLRRSDNGGDEPDVALPAMIDGHLVLIGGTQLEKDAAKLIAKDARFAAKTDDAPLFIHADLGKLLTTVLGADMGGAPFDPADMLKIIGLNSLKELTVKLKPDGKAVAGQIHIGMKKEGRGLLNMIPSTNKQPSLLSAVPADSEAFSVSAFDIAPIYAGVKDMWNLLDGFVPMTFEDAIGGFNEMTKIRLKEDLLDHLGKEMLSVQSVEALKDMDLGDDDPAAFMAGTVYGIALTDGKAFGESLEKALRSRGMHVGRKREEYANVQINRMKIAGMFPLEYVVTDDMLLVAVGDGEATGRALRDVIDTRAAGENGVPAIVKKHANSFPAGWSGIGYTPIGAIFEGVVGGLQATGQFGEEMDMVAGVVKGVVADMNRLGISSILAVSYCDETGITQHMRW